jgi:hypothetical protein
MAGTLGHQAFQLTGAASVAWLGCSLLFVLSTVSLLLPQTVRFFKAQNKPSSE